MPHSRRRHDALEELLFSVLKGIWDFARSLNPFLDPVLGKPDPAWRTILRSTIAAANDLLDGYGGAAAFLEDWKWIRLAIPLQVRLAVEQMLWDRGGDWRKLVTGFSPVRRPH